MSSVHVSRWDRLFIFICFLFFIFPVYYIDLYHFVTAEKVKQWDAHNYRFLTWPDNVINFFRKFV